MMQSARREAQVRVRVKRNPRQFFRKLILLIIALYVVFLVYGFIHGLLISRIAKVEQVKQGVIQNTVPVKGLLIRNEDIVNAPRNGKLKIIVPEGEKVRVGQVLAQVITASLDNSSGEMSYNVVASKSGLVSYHVDGLEKLYSPDNIKELDLNKINTIKTEDKQLTPGCDVEEGKPVAKIINNLDPVYIVGDLGQNSSVIDKDKHESYSVFFGQDVNNLYRAEVEERSFRGKQGQILLSFEEYNKSLINNRHIDFNIITSRYEGCYVPKDCLVRKDGQDGIFTVYKERVKWKKISINGEADGKVIVSGVTPDVKVILNPQYVKEGYPVND